MALVHRNLLVTLKYSLHGLPDDEAFVLAALRCSFPLHIYPEPSLEEIVLPLGWLFLAPVRIAVVATVPSFFAGGGGVLRWVFVATCGLPLVVVSRGYSLLRCVGFSLWWLLLLQSTGSRHAGFSSCSTQAP